MLLLEKGLDNMPTRDLQPLTGIFSLPRPCSDPDFNSGTGITPEVISIIKLKDTLLIQEIKHCS